MCDESGHTNFLLYPTHVILLTPAQARLSPCSGFVQAGSPLLTLIAVCNAGLAALGATRIGVPLQDGGSYDR